MAGTAWVHKEGPARGASLAVARSCGWQLRRAWCRGQGGRTGSWNRGNWGLGPGVRDGGGWTGPRAALLVPNGLVLRPERATTTGWTNEAPGRSRACPARPGIAGALRRRISQAHGSRIVERIGRLKHLPRDSIHSVRARQGGSGVPPAGAVGPVRRRIGVIADTSAFRPRVPPGHASRSSPSSVDSAVPSPGRARTGSASRRGDGTRCTSACDDPYQHRMDDSRRRARDASPPWR